MSSTSLVNQELLDAEDITRYIFNTNDANIEEQNKGSTIAKRGYLDASFLKGADGNEDFIIVECESGGYAIYERETMELIEYSNSDKSPYTSITKSNRRYLGPANYYKKNNDNIENINTKHTIKNEHTYEITKDFKSKIKNNRGKRVEKSKEANNRALEISRSYNAKSVNPGPTGKDPHNANSYEIFVSRNISESWFFVDNSNHGDNRDGTCVSVSIQLLLAYNNWTVDGRIIPLETGKDDVIFLPEGWENLERYDKNKKKTTSEDSKTDLSTTFYEVIKGYINPYARTPDEMSTKPEHFLNNGASNADAANGIISYLEEYTTVESSEYNISYDSCDSDACYNVLVGEINNDRPVNASVYSFYSDGAGGYYTVGHSIVVYGFQTIVFNGDYLKGFIAHFGWQGYSNVWFNSDWVKGYLTLNFTHEHIFNDTINDELKHIDTCITCGIKAVQTQHVYDIVTKRTDIYEKNVHDRSCVCGNSYTERHIYIHYTYENASSAGNSTSHRKTCVCGYSTTEAHNFKINSCRDCGYVKKDITQESNLDEDLNNNIDNYNQNENVEENS